MRSAAAFSPAFLLLPFLHTAVMQTSTEVQLQLGLFFGTHFCMQAKKGLVLARTVRTHTRDNIFSLPSGITPRALPEATQILGIEKTEAVLRPEYSWP